MSKLKKFQKAFDVNKRKQLEIVDENGELVEVMYYKPLTIQEKVRARELLPAKDRDNNNMWALRLLCMKAQDEAGDPLFDAGEMAELKRTVPSDILDRMVLAIVGQSTEVEDELLSEDDRKSDS